MEDNVTHYKDSDGYERWYEYNENGNVTHTKDSNGHEEWKEQDEKGNVTYNNLLK